MSKNYFYLIAKEKNGPKFKVISVNNNEIYMYDRDIEYRMLDLPKIDLFTGKFKSEKELISYLVSKGKLDCDDYNMHIVKRNGKNINFLNIAFNADQGIMDENVSEVGNYYNDFFMRIYREPMYSDFVYHDFTNISKKFINGMKLCDTDFRGLCSSKFLNGGWALRSYGVIREIEESYDSYEKFKMNISDDIGLIDMRNLLIETDKDYDPNQYSLFDFMDDKDKEEGYQYVKGRFSY